MTANKLNIHTHKLSLSLSVVDPNTPRITIVLTVDNSQELEMQVTEFGGTTLAVDNSPVGFCTMESESATTVTAIETFTFSCPLFYNARYRVDILNKITPPSTEGWTLAATRDSSAITPSVTSGTGELRNIHVLFPLP